MEYTIDYFINKFSNIPEHLWSTGSIISTSIGATCMLGHCGVTDNGRDYVHTEESEALFGILKLELSEWDKAYAFNDNYKWKGYVSPKQCVLTVLSRIKEYNNDKK